MNKSNFFYDLPQELIAQSPIEPRDSARMLVYDRHNKKRYDSIFRDLTDFLHKGDVLVINNTKVLPARIYGNKPTGARVEFLLHKRINLTDWEVLVRPARKAMIGDKIIFSDKLSATVLKIGDDGIRIVRFEFDGVFEDILNSIGEMPLPHYIHKKLEDNNSYQTVYAKIDGSSAAPTAGLHFTPELMTKVKNMGVEVVEVLLHVGLGTFRPVKTENILDHKMHSEYYSVTEDAANRLNLAKKEGRRIIAVGTTSVRVLESSTNESGKVMPGSGNTDIFIYPPYKFKSVDALITNFHLPESTLIMLVSAFCGIEETLDLYKYAVEHKYKFFSFGDVCLFL